MASPDYQYVSEPGSGLECVICLEVAENPWQHNECGRLLCEKCLDKHGKDKPCPNCRLAYPQYFKDNKSRRDIQALMVSCPNAECDEVMERQNLPQHVHMTCPCILNSCKYKSIGCDTELNKKDMSAHEEDDKLHLHMALDTVAALRAECLMFKRSGSVTFTIRDFQKMKMASESFTGAPFYTHAYGYLIALRLKANGHGSKVGTHVAVGICLLSGKYDSVLKWPFVGSVSFTLMNQLQDDDHYSHTLVIDDKRAGDAVGTNLIPHTELSLDPFGTTQYLKDDTMYIRVSVEVNGRKPWLED